MNNNLLLTTLTISNKTHNKSNKIKILNKIEIKYPHNSKTIRQIDIQRNLYRTNNYKKEGNSWRIDKNVENKHWINYEKKNSRKRKKKKDKENKYKSKWNFSKKD